MKFSLTLFILLLSSPVFHEIPAEVILSTTLVTTSIAILHDKKIPSQMLHTAQGIMVIPKMTTAGFLVTASNGEGIVVVRQAQGWSNPILMTFSRAGVGLKAGLKSGSIVLVFTNRKKLESILTGHLKLGTDLTIALGAKGITIDNLTDIYDYSDEEGLFAGVGIESHSLQVNQVYNEGLYGQPVELATILTEPLTPSSKIAQNAINNLKMWLNSR